MSNEMIGAFNKLFSGADIDPVTKAAVLGFFANGWEAAEADYLAQADDFTRRTLDDLKTEREARINDTNGWVNVVEYGKKQLVDLYRKIAIPSPGYCTEAGFYIHCMYCGAEIEQNPDNHKEDCLWVEAKQFLEGEK